jgi:hypothetical protein
MELKLAPIPLDAARTLLFGPNPPKLAESTLPGGRHGFVTTLLRPRRWRHLGRERFAGQGRISV